MIKNDNFEFNRNGDITLLLHPNKATLPIVSKIVKDCIAHARKQKIKKPKRIVWPPLLTDVYDG